MRTSAAIVCAMLAASSAAAAVPATVTPRDLAAAINRAPAQWVPYRKTRLSPADVRAVRCIAPDEEPTEFQCKWRQRIHSRWVKRTTWLALDGAGWHVMDA